MWNQTTMYKQTGSKLWNQTNQTDFLGRENDSTMWNHFVHSLVPHCGTSFFTQRVSQYINHQLSIVWTDFLGRETVPQCGTIMSTQKVSLYCRKLFVYVWLTLWVKKLVPQCGIKLLTNRFHIVEQLPRPRKSVRFL